MTDKEKAELKNLRRRVEAQREVIKELQIALDGYKQALAIMALFTIDQTDIDEIEVN